MTAQGFTDQGETKADNLLAGEFPRIVELATVSGGKYARGTILGKITASGKCTICTSAATDGSKDAYAILAEAGRYIGKRQTGRCLSDRGVQRGGTDCRERTYGRWPERCSPCQKHFYQKQPSILGA